MHAPERTCGEIESQLPLHVGGDLEVPLVEGLERHLSTCPACALELERLRASRAALLGLRAVDAVEPKPELDLWPRLRPELAAAGAFSPRKGRETSRWLPLGLLAAAGVIGFLVWLGGDEGAGGPRGPRGHDGAEPLVAEDALDPETTDPSLGTGRRLERAAPGDEHLADNALPFAAGGALELPGGPRPAHVLATDNGLR